MPLDYRVTLDCGHTFTYRTTVSPLEREHLRCDECGAGQHAARAVLREPSRCEFHDFTSRSAWTGPPATDKASPAA